jgi:hypothetical protein
MSTAMTMLAAVFKHGWSSAAATVIAGRAHPHFSTPDA